MDDKKDKKIRLLMEFGSAGRLEAVYLECDTDREEAILMEKLHLMLSFCHDQLS